MHTAPPSSSWLLQPVVMRPGWEELGRWLCSVCSGRASVLVTWCRGWCMCRCMPGGAAAREEGRPIYTEVAASKAERAQRLMLH